MQQEEEAERQLEALRTQLSDLSQSKLQADAKVIESGAECKRLSEDLETLRALNEQIRQGREQDANRWEQNRHQLETQVIENAQRRVLELRQRLASRVEKLLADVPPRSADMKGNTAAAVLHTRIHEFLDLLTHEGVPIQR